MPIPRGVSNSPEMNRLYKLLEAYTDERPAVEVLGISDSGVGSDVTLTFRANRHTPHVFVHVQSDKAGEGGESYDATNFVSSTRYNAVGEKKHTVTITRDDDAHYYAYLVPAAQIPPGCGTYTKFDGVDGEDFMSFADLGKRTVAEAELEDAAVTSAKIADLAVTASKMVESGRGFVTDVDFTPASDDEVTWTSGSLILADGTSYSIGSGTTGTMTAGTYLYFDPTVSTTALQTTTTLANATGDRRVLVGVAFPASDASQEARFVSSRKVAVNEEDIAANSITADTIAAAAVTTAKLAAGAITAEKIQVGTLDGSQNLLGADAGPEQSGTGNTPLLLPTHDLADLDVEPGDTLSAGMQLKTDGGTEAVRLEIRYRDASNTIIETVGSDAVTGSTYQRSVVEDSEVPANADNVRLLVRNTSGTDAETTFGRRAMLNRGPVALPFHEPPFRIQRETIDEISGQILTGQVTDGAIETVKIADGAVVANKLAAASVVAGKIDAGAIDATNLFVDGIITAAKMNVTSLEAIAAEVGTLDITDDLFLDTTKAIKFGTSASPATITKTMRIAGLEFVPDNDGTTWDSFTTGIRPGSTGADQVFRAPIVLPPGVTITAIRVRSYRETTGDKVEVDLWEQSENFGVATPEATVTNDGSGAWETDEVTGLSLDITNRTIGLGATLHSSSNIADSRLGYVEIDYEVSDLSQAI